MSQQAAIYQIKDCFMPLGLQVKDVDTTGRRIQFYVAAYGNVDSHNDVILPGAFTKTLKENGPGAKVNSLVHLKDHSTEYPLGKVEEVEDRPDGLVLTSKVSKTTYGDNVLALEADGVYQHSIGYRAVKQQKSHQGHNELIELRLFEGSSVVFASNPNTPTIGIKGLPTEEQESVLLKQLNTLEKHLRHGNLTDETCQLLVIQTLQLKQAISDLLAQSLQPAEPATVSTQAEEEPTPEPKQSALEHMFKTLSNN